MIEDIDAGRPVSAQSPLSAAWKNGDAQYKISLCDLGGLICNCTRKQCTIPYQKVVDSTTIFTVPGNWLCLVNVSSMSIEASSSDSLASTAMSTSCSCNVQGGEPADRKTPAAAAWVSVAMLREAAGLWLFLEFRAMRMCDGLVAMVTEQSVHVTDHTPRSVSTFDRIKSGGKLQIVQ